MKDNTSFPCIIPTLATDYTNTSRHLYTLFDMLSISRLIFIGPVELKQPVLTDAADHDMRERVEYINENDILSFDKVKQAYHNRISEIEKESGVPNKISRTGWYYQQFLKMEFHRICDSEYYLCWDADTIPLKIINMFHTSGLPYFDIRPEHTHTYFETIHNLFGFSKIVSQSFVSEHMLFSKHFMSEMIDEIMTLPLNGDDFYTKIFSAIQHPFNGFSEFETYGTWTAMRHINSYRLRDWRSLRNAGFLIDRNQLTEDDLAWLATGFDAASFERYQKMEPDLFNLFRDSEYRQKMSADIFYKTLLEMGIFGEYKDGGIMVGDVLFPT